MNHCTRCSRRLAGPLRIKEGLCLFCKTGRAYPAREEHFLDWVKRQRPYQVKIRCLGDTRPWEEIPVSETWQFIHPDSPAEHARTMKQFDEFIREIRINAMGSLQGVYI